MLTCHVMCDRYGAVADKEGTFCLYTTHIPVVRSKRPDPCCIVRWNTQDNVSVTKMLNTGSELLSALAVRYACNVFHLIIVIHTFLTRCKVVTSQVAIAHVL